MHLEECHLRELSNLIVNFRNLKQRISDSIPVHPLPIWETAKNYQRSDLKGDFQAGINVALLAFPQGMAYAAIAGLPIAYGIIGSGMAAIFGGLFSRSRFIVFGPTNATAVLIFASMTGLTLLDGGERLAVLPLMVLMAGIFLVLGAFLGIASWVQYISRSVVAGYITAAAMFIIVNQLQPVLGFRSDALDSGNFFLLLWHSILHIPDSHWPTVLLSLGCALFYFGLKKYAPRIPAVAVSLIVFSAMGSGLDRWIWSPELDSLRYLDALDLSSLRIAIPALSPDWVSQVAGMAMVLAFLSILEGASIGKSLASRSGEKLNLNQEIFSMGIANIACAFTRGMPASGSLTRSQLNWSSGAKTSFASLFSGMILLVGAWMVGPLTAWVPLNVLGVLVVAIGISLINRHVLKVVWTATRSDRIVLLTTFLAALLVRLDFAIILGTTVSILLFLRKAAQPELVEYAPGKDGHWQPAAHASGDPLPEISIIHVEGDLFFGAAELFQDQMRRTIKNPNLKVAILKLRNAHHIDATSILALEELLRTMREENRYLLICELRAESARIILESGLQEQIGSENVFPDEPTNSTLSVAKAVRRARELIGNREADVRIFLGGSKREQEKKAGE